MIFLKKRGIYGIGFFILTFLFSGCASRYFVTDPAEYVYSTPHQTGDLEYYVIRDVLKKTGNTKYSRKARKKEVSMVSVKLINHGDSAVIFSPSAFRVASDTAVVNLLSPMGFYHKIRQRGGWYFLYGLLNISYSTLDVSTIPPEYQYHYYPIGAPIAFLNYFIALSANRKLRENLLKRNLLDRRLLPGETLYGYLYLDSPNPGKVVIETR